LKKFSLNCHQKKLPHKILKEIKLKSLKLQIIKKNKMINQSRNFN